ncbi:MAG: MipA/OmpV family protein [Massilia sp.]|nr:MipA/OmpV family protein [Massilia sp.]
MTKLFAFACALVSCAAVSSAALAQTPAANPMPDGSHDMYAGAGVVSKPRYEGGADREHTVLPVFQFQWSNGVFVSGLSAGIHMARTPQLEFGPLVEVQPRRDDGGNGDAAAGIDDTGSSILAVPDSFAAKLPTDFPANFPRNRLAGMADIRTRLQAGGFLNLYLTPQWRLTSRTLYGAGNERHGARLDLGVQRLAMHVGGQHRVTLAAGVTLVNRSHNAAFFGVSEEESVNSGNATYAPAGGLKDVHLRARWTWVLAPGWVLTSHAQASRLQADARRSPLVLRPTNLTVSTAIAWRF